MNTSATNDAPRVSVVIPVYNEAESVAPLVAEFDALRAGWGDFELLLVDDGSRDDSPARLAELRKTRPWLRVLRAARNAGQSAAMLQGLRAARGAVLVTMDGDLQNNPADIPALVERVGPGADAVCGYRATRRDAWSRRAASRLGNAVRNRFTRDGVRDTGCSLKAFKRECAAALPWLNGVHRFMPAYFRLRGYTVAEYPVDHRQRRHGVSNYTNLKRLPRTIYDLIGFCWYRSRRLNEPAATEISG